MAIHFCDTCEHFTWHYVCPPIDSKDAQCKKGHAPDFKQPVNIIDSGYGYVRDCDDYKIDDDLFGTYGG